MGELRTNGFNEHFVALSVFLVHLCEITKHEEPQRSTEFHRAMKILKNTYFRWNLLSLRHISHFLFHISYFTFLIFMTACGPAYNNEAFKKLSTQDQIKYQKYIIQGRDLYKVNCVSCHQKDGKGLKKLIPPLAGSDYLQTNQANSVKLIRNGAKESITVNGIGYPPTMPANTHLTNLEIAEILTYINNSWDNEFGFVDGKKVRQYLK